MDRHRTSFFKKSTQKIAPDSTGLASVTTRPGVYLYCDSHGTVLYVGKAKNVKKRVRQYFVRRERLTTKTQTLVPQISSIQTIATDSEFDALLLEAHLIREFMPKYNSIAKDDKSPLYIAITFEELLPRIILTRKTTIDSWKSHPKRAIFGPFQSGRIARRLLLSVRHSIPFCSQKQRNGNPCFYTHIGLCDPCPSLISKMPEGIGKAQLLRRYKHNIRRVALVLSGQASKVRIELTHAMNARAGVMAYEEAGEIKKQVDALDMLLTHIFDPSVYTDGASQPSHIHETRLTDLVRVLSGAGMTLTSLKRIECIDISTIQGSWSTGSLVVFTDGIPDTGQYRRFRIKLGGKPNDVGMMTEVITRRFGHAEWPNPNLLIVDGGKPQVKGALNALSGFSNIPIIGLAKRFEEIIIPSGNPSSPFFSTIRLETSRPALQILQHIRDEAHRFAKKYHTSLRSLS
ncbi:MAG: GIY-YIG nuclease family protein [Candidatus Gottesmanbacteria bacterium]|nr:GIY-YIG nuclease family protein [Candidatus Gottesmanbacteria bacterium]